MVITKGFINVTHLFKHFKTGSKNIDKNVSKV